MRKVKDDQEKAQQEHEEIKAEVDSKEKKFEKFKKWVQSVNDIGRGVRDSGENHFFQNITLATR